MAQILRDLFGATVIRKHMAWRDLRLKLMGLQPWSSDRVAGEVEFSKPSGDSDAADLKDAKALLEELSA